MFQNMLMTALTPLSTTNEISCWDNRPFISKWPEYSNSGHKKGEDITKTIKKKSKRNRTAFTTDQLLTLERAFAKHEYIDAKQRGELATMMKIGDRQIKIWFQNRRMKKKRIASETSSDCESSNASPAPVVTSSMDAPEQFKSPGFENIHVVQNQFQIPPRSIETPQDNCYIFPQLVHNSPYGFNGNIYPTEFFPSPTQGYYYPEGRHQIHQCYEFPEAAEWYDFDVNQFQNNGYSWQ